MADDVAVPEWAKTSLPEALHDVPFLKDADSPETFKQRLVDAGQYMGNSLRLPSNDAGDEDRKAFYTKVMERVPGLMVTPNLEDAEGMQSIYAKLGRPDNADGYSVPEGAGIEGEALGQLKSLAFKSNLTQQQFAAYVATVSETSKAQTEAQIAAHAEAMSTLKGEWGAAYDQNVGQIAALLKTNTTTPPYIIEQLEKGNLPADQVRWLHSIASTVSNEDGQFHQQDPNKAPAILAPQEASARADEITKRIMDTGPNRPSRDEMIILQKKAEAYEYMAAGQRPPPDLMRFVQT